SSFMSSFSSCCLWLRFLRFVLCCAGALCFPPSFPTRRSSDLSSTSSSCSQFSMSSGASRPTYTSPVSLWYQAGKVYVGREAPERSEEHTSELQSRFDLVCRLLLEEKNVWTGISLALRRLSCWR